MKNIFLLVALLGTSIVFADNHKGKSPLNDLKRMNAVWSAEDCANVSSGAAIWLYAAGEALKEAEKLDKEGDEESALEAVDVASKFSGMSSDFTHAFAVFCKGPRMERMKAGMEKRMKRMKEMKKGKAKDN
tara:strand:- start:591 stop:983 length:393 start_codon:yes stop_codon:yes gene_type:complete